MKKHKQDILIFIPVYNEEKNIEKVIDDIRKYSKSDILIINDGSTDSSDSIIKNISEKNNGNLFYINHHTNEGYGKKLINGFNFSIKNNYKYIITIDGDGQHEPENIPNFVNTIKKNNIDILSGSRYLDPKMMLSTPPPNRQKVNHRITKILSAITDYDLTDSFCGFKIYSVSALKKLKLTEKGFGLPLQLILQAHKQKLILKEMPIELIYTDEKRTFGVILNNTLKRFSYYIKIIRKEIDCIESNGYRSSS